MWKIIGGVIVGVISSLLNALGYITQKKAHLLNAHSTRPIYKHPVWLLGFGLLVIAAIISLVTMGFLDQTTLSSLSSVTIVFSILFSTLLLKEPFNRWVLLQLVLMLTGASLMLVFSNKVEREFTLDDMLFLYKRPIATVFLIAYTCMFVVLTLYALMITKSILKLKQIYDASMEHLESDSAGSESFEMELTVFQGTTQVESQSNQDNEIMESPPRREHETASPPAPPRRGYKETEDLIEFVSQVPRSQLHNYLRRRWYVKIPQIAFPWFGGYLSGLNTLFFKTFLEMTKTADQFNNFEDAFPFVILVSALGALYLTLVMLNKGLKHFNAIDTVPIYESSVILHNISCGGIVLNEFSTLKTKNIILFAVGSVLVMAGIMILIKKKDDRNKQKFTRRVLLETRHDTDFSSASPPTIAATLEEPLTNEDEEKKN